MVRFDRVLVIAPHPDDEVLGAGGAIARFAKAGSDVTVLTIAGHMPPVYDMATYRRTLAEAAHAHGVLGISRSVTLDIPATMVNREAVHILNGRVMSVMEECRPDLVLAPFPDRHIDHRVVFDSVMVAARPVGSGVGVRMLATYETLSETHWNAPGIEPAFQGNWIVDITESIDLKLEAVAAFVSQIPPFPGARSIEALKALAIFRGTQAGFAFGEAFQVVRYTT
jgi:N-acetylglucosamine malate deacetylase 1